MYGSRTDTRDTSVLRVKACPAAALCISAMVSGSVVAQDPGRWWWDAAVGIGQRTNRNSVDGTELDDHDQQELAISLGLNGFIVHPAIASFRLTTDLVLANVEGQRSFDSNQAGFGADVRLIPYGAFPVHLYAKRTGYDYTRGTQDPFTLAGAPDGSTRVGGDFRVARGILSGLQAGFESETIDFLDPGADQQQLGRGFLDWSRTTGTARHRLRLDQHRRDYGTIDLEIDDVTVRIEERVEFSPTWDWEMDGSGLLRNVTDASGIESGTDVYRLRNRFQHTVRARDLFDFRVNLGRIEFDDNEDGTESGSFSVFYRWRPRPAWEIAPFASYADQSTGSLAVTSPRAGTAVTWRRPGPSLDVVMGGQVSYGQVERSGFSDSGKASELALSLTGSLAHGRPAGLRKELDFNVAHDELRQTRDLVLHLPDLGLPPAGIGTEDFYRARVSLGHRWNSSHFNGWTEWNLRQASEEIAAGEFETETVSGTLQFGRAGFGLQASGGQTEVRRELPDDLSVSFLGTTAWWQPWRYVRLRGVYRSDERDFELTADIDAERYEAGVVLRYGQLVLDVYAYESTERLTGGPERRNEGLNWTLSTRFSGWLPVITGTKRRGVVR